MQEALARRDPLANGLYHRSQPIVLTGQPVAVFTLAGCWFARFIRTIWVCTLSKMAYFTPSPLHPFTPMAPRLKASIAWCVTQ